MTRTIRRLEIVGVICGMTLFCSAANAQESRGSIAGLIVDSSGGALPGVTVTVVNNGTNSRTALVTSETGQYAALFLLPGTYHVTAELSGFQTKDHPSVQVRVGERSQLDMDNDNLRGAAVTGTLNSEFTIDGSSNIVSQARVGIQPPANAIEEFKVETAAYDAQIGHTGAGGVNLALKSGTNTLHGAVSYYNRDDARSANLFASNRLLHVLVR